MNWGAKLILGMSLFVLFIAGMSAKIIFNVASKSDDLIERDYYEKGLNYDKEYQMQANAVADSVAAEFFTDKKGLIISLRFPTQYKLVCKRPSDSRKDRIFEGFAGPDGKVIIPYGKLEKGAWMLHLEFGNEKAYLVEKGIVVP